MKFLLNRMRPVVALSFGLVSFALGTLVAGVSNDVSRGAPSLERGIASAQVSAPEPSGERDECVDARAEARLQAYGFNHVVVIDNRCEAAQRCTVSSDVNPNPQRVEVRPGARAELLLWRDSPARTFQARVDCESH